MGHGYCSLGGFVTDPGQSWPLLGLSGKGISRSEHPASGPLKPGNWNFATGSLQQLATGTWPMDFP
ncbi:MAG: hypothetical protein EBU30_05530 [Synechococcaceae bacterium WB6_3B_236]|nr:hypothetical protein [Synechococcaceae bacterium WB6_3B_236]